MTEYLTQKEVHAKIVRMAMLKEILDHLDDLYEYMKGKRNKVKQEFDMLDKELRAEMQRQYEEAGVAEIHPAVKTMKRTVRDFSDTNIGTVLEHVDEGGLDFLVINESEKRKIIQLVMDYWPDDELLSVDQKKLNKLAAKKIPHWAKYTESDVRVPTIQSKLGEYLILPDLET